MNQLSTRISSVAQKAHQLEDRLACFTRFSNRIPQETTPKQVPKQLQSFHR